MRKRYYVVTKASSDGTFEVGDHIAFCEDGSIVCFEVGCWLNVENVPEALKGMDYKIDSECA